MSLFKTVRNALGLLTAIEVANLLVYHTLQGDKPQEVQIAAHRGGAALAPENTPEAFRNAARIGADWIEFDLHRTSDGVLVVMHDDTVNRMTNGQGFIKDMTWEQIRALRLVNGEQVMSFAEIIAFARERNMGILPELKSTDYYPGMEIQALELVRDAGYLDKTIFLSFQWDVLENLKEAEPAARVAPLYGLYQWDLSKPLPANAEIVAPMAEMVLINPWMIQQAHAAGRQVWVWFGPLDRPAVYRLALELGVDGLIVNDPVAAMRIAGVDSKSLPLLKGAG